MSSVPLEGPTCHSGSIIECESGVLGESIPLTGVPFGLHYRSETQRGFKTQIKVPYSGNADPVDLTNFLGAEVEVKIMGKKYFFAIPYVPNGFKNGFVTVDWDRTDGNNQPVSGTVSANIRVAWVYKAQNGRTPTFGAAGAVAITGNRGARVIRMNRYFNIPVGAFDASGQSLGGWTVGLQHVLDPEHGMLWRGDGSKVDLHAMPGTVWTETSTIANCSYRQMAVGPDGRKFVWTRSALHEVVNGALVPIGTPNAPTANLDGQSGPVDPLPTDTNVADGKKLSEFYFRRSVGSQSGTGLNAGIIPLANDQFLLGVNLRIWKVGPAPNRNVTLVAGKRADDGTGYVFTPDGQPALEGSLPGGSLSSLSQGPDGSLYYVDERGTSLGTYRIRRILPNGTLDTLIGTTTEGTPPANCWQPNANCVAKGLSIGGIAGSALTVDPAGNVYFTMQKALNSDLNRAGTIWRITPGGRLSLVAGLADQKPATTYREGAMATDTSLSMTLNAGANPSALAWRDGSLYYVEASSGQVRVINPEGRTRVIAGNGTSAFTEGGAARTQGINPAFGLAAGPGGNLYFTRNVANGSGGAFDGYFQRIELGNLRRKSNGDYLLPSPDGAEVYRFDSKGRHQETLSSSRGKSIWQFHYDSLGRLDKVTDAQALDSQGIVGTHHDTTLAYSSNQVTITGPWGKVNTISLDGYGYVSGVTEPETSYTLSHTTLGLLLSYTQAGGANHTFTYEPTGRLSNDKDGQAYSAGTSLVRTDALTSYTSSVTTAEGRTTTHVVDSSRDPADALRIELRRHIDPNNLETKDARYADDSRKVTLPDGTTIVTQLSPDPRFGISARFVSASTITSGTKSVNTSQTVTAATTPPSDPLALTSATTTRKVNNVTLSTTTFALGAGGEATLETTSSLGRKSRVILDAQDRVTRIEPQGVLPALGGGTVSPYSISIAYDNDGNVATVTQGARTTTYSYEALTGFLSSVVGPFGTASSTYTRGDGLPATTTLPGGRTLQSTWNAHGGLTNLTVPRDVNTNYAHGFGIDNFDRVSSYNPPSAGFSPKDSIYAYDKESAIKSVTQPTGLLSTERDFGGRTTKLTFPEVVAGISRTIETTYNQQRVATITSKLDGTADATLTYGYDGLMQTSEQLQVAASTPAINQTVSHNYDALMRPYTRTVGGQTATFNFDGDNALQSVVMGGITYSTVRETAGNGVLKTSAAGALTDKYEYDAYGALVHYAVTLSGTGVVYDVAYNRSSATGRVTSKTETINGVYSSNACTTSYTYDASNFLATSTKSGTSCSGSAGYTYDLAGNRTATNHVYDPQDRLTSDGQWTYRYINDGAVAGLRDPWTEYYTYTTDALGNLRRMSNVWGGDLRYVIDGLGRRVAKTNGSNGLVVGYLWDGGHIVGEVDGTGAVVAHYVYVNRPNVPDFLVRKEGSVWNTFRLVSDQAGSPKLLIRLTGTIGIVERYDWDDWGVALVTWPGAFHPFGFAGGQIGRAHV